MRAQARRSPWWPAILSSLLTSSCVTAAPRSVPDAHPPASEGTIAGYPRGLAEIVINSRVVMPIDLAFPNRDAMLVAERSGRITRVQLDGSGATSTFLDLRELLDRLGSEEGLTGLALHPRFATNGTFFLRYQLPYRRRTVVSRFQARGPAYGEADPRSEEVLLTQEHGLQRRPGGLAFGPDGLLYIGFGDQEDAEDQEGATGVQETAQDPRSLLGKILRIDVDVVSADLPYGIPPGNLVADEASGQRGEIFALGFRNPRQLSFDKDRLWAVDPIDDRCQEINQVRAGDNHGWPAKLADHWLAGRGERPSRYASPLTWYEEDWGEALVGGCVYRGTRFPALAGRYVFADGSSGRIGALAADKEATRRTLLESEAKFSAVVRGPDGEPHFLTTDGGVFRFE